MPADDQPGVSHQRNGMTDRDSNVLRPVLTAPVSAVPALFAAVRVRPGPPKRVKTASGGARRRWGRF